MSTPEGAATLIWVNQRCIRRRGDGRYRVVTIARDLSRELVSFPRQRLTYPQLTLSALKSDIVDWREDSIVNQLQQLVAGAAQLGAQGAAQLGAAQLGAQLDVPQHRLRQQPPSRGMCHFGMHSFGMRKQLRRQQPLLQPELQQLLATGAQQEGAQAGAAQVGAQAAGAAQAGAHAGAAQVGAQAGAAHEGAQAGAAQLGAAEQQPLL